MKWEMGINPVEQKRCLQHWLPTKPMCMLASDPAADLAFYIVGFLCGKLASPNFQDYQAFFFICFPECLITDYATA